MLAALCVLLFHISATLSLELDLPSAPIIVGEPFNIHWQRKPNSENDTVNPFAVTLQNPENAQPGILTPQYQQVRDTALTEGELEFTFTAAGSFALVANEIKQSGLPRVLATTENFQVELPQQQPHSTTSSSESTPTSSPPSNTSLSSSLSNQSSNPSSSVSSSRSETPPGVSTTSSTDAGKTLDSPVGIPTVASDPSAPSTSDAASQPTDAVNAVSKSSKTGKIVGAVLGGLACLAALAGLLFLLQRRKANRYSVAFNRDMMVRSPADALLTAKYAPVDALVPSRPRSELTSIDGWDTPQQRHGV